ncbi:MAG: MBL fold metallo-hydrolase [Erysipelotrichaceae bacterium]|nr:MBL fold metallo-hydrolase [Erysipelotrichaceae bacterium]
MKNKAIYLAFFAIIFLLAFDYRLFVLIGVLLYWRIRFNDHSYIYLLLILLLISIPRTSDTIPSTDIAKIIKVKENYKILLIDNRKYLTYDLDNVNYDDIIRFNGVYDQLESDISNNGFDYRNWALSKDINKIVNINDYEIIKPGDSLRAKLFKKAKKIDDPIARNFILKLLFQYDDIEESSTSIFAFMGSTQTFFSSSIYFIESLLVLFLYSNVVNIIIVLLILLVAYQFNLSFIIYQLLLSRIFSKIEDKYDRLGYLVITLLVINPYYIYDLRFQLIVLIRFVALFRRHLHFYDGSLVVLFVQLVNFFRADLFSIFIYRLLRKYYLIVFWITCFCLLIGNVSLIRYICDRSNEIAVEIPKLIFTGKPSIFIISIFMFFLTYNNKNNELKRILIVFALILINQYQTLFYPYGEVTFLNIGQGDSCLIRFAFNNKVNIIDTGSTYNQTKLQRYLDALGVKKIEAIMISHHDSDHDGNLDWLIDNYQVDAVYDEKMEYIKLGKFQLTGLLSKNYYDDINDNSQIWTFSINGIDYLFLGDISAEVETDLIKDYPNLQADVLKIAHHGSNTSTSDYLLRSLKPALAIISAGKDNVYHHPHQDVIQRLIDYRIHYLKTFDHGDISIYFTRFINLLHTSNNEFVIMNKVIE